MIRSLIRILSVLVFMTTCVQSTAAQPNSNFYSIPLRHSAQQESLHSWVELANQGITESILSSDAYHDDFRFRVAPLKKPTNWEMPIVDIRPAKQIQIDLDSPKSTETKSRSITNFKIPPVVDWISAGANNLSTEYCRIRDRFEQTVAITTSNYMENRSAVNTTGIKDYWNYYGDCDRWNIVFAIPSEARPSNSAGENKVTKTTGHVQRKTRFHLGLHPISAQIEEHWENMISLYQSFSLQSVTSQP